MNILFLYNSTQTYTNTVFEHLLSFAKLSEHKIFFCHVDQYSEFAADLSHFDAVGLHYTVRLPFDQVSSSLSTSLSEYSGLKFLFIQDEYDHTHRAWYWIKKLKLNLIFTVVPEAGIEQVYPASEFPGVRFVSNLTGYVPVGLDGGLNVAPPSARSLIIGYRGRPLPVRYGMLGFEKVGIGEIAKKYCDSHGVKTDIAWSEESRIYGPKWYEFMVSCRSMLGSESGSNVFDWDGTLEQTVGQFKIDNPSLSDFDVYIGTVRCKEIDGIMNQVSPRIFEAISARTVLVLFEGNYSGVVKAGEHFIPLKKDGSNLNEVIALLQDGDYVDAMAERAYRDVIESGKYSYEAFVKFFDEQIEYSWTTLGEVQLSKCLQTNYISPSPITTCPIRAKPVCTSPSALTQTSVAFFKQLALFFWGNFPEKIRIELRPMLKKFLGKRNS